MIKRIAALTVLVVALVGSHLAVPGGVSADPPDDIALGGSTVAENANFAVVGVVVVFDPEEENTSVEFVSGPGSTHNAQFLMGTTMEGDIQLRTAEPLDFEAGSTRSIRLKATDQDLETYEEAFTITVTNVNEAPTDIALSDTPASDQPSGSTVATLSSTDPEGGTMTYALVPGSGADNNASFQISGTQLRTKAVLTENTAMQIRIRSTDSGNLSFEESLAFVVADGGAPTDITLSSDVIAENHPSPFVGAFDTDDDVGDVATFTLVSGSGSTDNAEFEISLGYELLTVQPLDFEAGSTRSIRVRATEEENGLFVEESFKITVTDVLGNVSINNGGGIEGTSKEKTVMEFFIYRTGEIEQAASVKALVVAGSADIKDDVAQLSKKKRKIKFKPGESEKYIQVKVVADSVAEGSEEFTIQLSDPKGVEINDGTATGAINNDD